MKKYFVCCKVYTKDNRSELINTHIIVKVDTTDLIGDIAFKLFKAIPQCAALINFWEEKINNE